MTQTIRVSNLILTTKYTPFCPPCQEWGIIKHMYKHQKPIAVAILVLVFATVFARNTKSDFPLIFKKDLLAHDESSNSVVAANITRKFFPPMVRVNPLNEQQGIWMEGPYWQHIPPMFAYVPYIFFELDGKVSIEVKRLSFAFLILLTGILFILLMYAYSKSLWGAAAATLAAIFWVNTPFTHELVTGYAFGVSDIVLAFTIVLGLDGVLWYLHKEKEGRAEFPWWKIGVMAMMVALPIMAKNLLGAIPAATFFLMLLVDYRGLSKKFFVALGFFAGILGLYYLSLYFASPETFKSEILISFFHVADYEGWGRPWHYFISNYLPQRYLFSWTWGYWIGLIFAGSYIFYGKLERMQKLLIAIPLLWFVWNLVAISLVESKIANFIFQTYLLSLFAIVYAFVLALKNLTPIPHLMRDPTKARSLLSQGSIANGLVAVLIISILVTGRSYWRGFELFKVVRAQEYNYAGERERFYGTAELMQSMGINQNDLVIIRVSDDDCWFRYPIIFLTGAESKTLLEMYFGFDEHKIKEKYKRMYFMVNPAELFNEIGQSQRIEFQNYSLVQFDLDRFNPEQIKQIVDTVIQSHNNDIQQDVERIKTDKTSCQWLVPDEILNAT